MPKRLARLLFSKHHVRGIYYYLGLIFSVTVLILDEYDIVETKTALYVALFFIATDFVAEMYDPHPNAPGPLFGKNPIGWIKSHFHRIWDNKNEDE